MLGAAAVGCASYKQTRAATTSIWSIRGTTDPGAVKECRLVAHVDSRDPERGCGLTVQPTPEECMRYQAKRAGADTLLMNGPMGDAYDCSGKAAAAGSVPSPAAPATATPQPSPRPTPTPLPANPTAPPSSLRVRVVPGREEVKGCVYLDDFDAKVECPEGFGKTSTDCVADRAIAVGGNTVLFEGDRVQIFSCKAAP